MQRPGVIDFALHDGLDAAAATRTFAATGRVRIAPFLASAAATALQADLRARTDWQQVLNSGDKVIELSREARAAMTADQHAALDNAVYAQARSGFQFRFETLRVADDPADRIANGTSLDRFAAWLSEGRVRDLLRQIVGTDAVEFADAQGTAYSPGDFLTGHDDRIAGKQRYAAYVFGLNPVWRVEWGGALLFHEADGTLGGQVPAFNTLDLFRVGQMHSVSEVTRAAAYRRYAITGWLRGR